MRGDGDGWSVDGSQDCGCALVSFDVCLMGCHALH